MTGFSKVLAVIGLLIAGMQAQSATVEPERFMDVPIDGGWTAGIGSTGLNGADDWVLNVTPDGLDAQVTSIAVEFSNSPGSVELFARDEGSIDSNGWMSQGGPILTTGNSYLQVAALTFFALDAFDYVLRVSGESGLVGTPYVLAVAAISPVPLPASAWLFLSVLLAGYLISRRQDGVAATTDGHYCPG